MAFRLHSATHQGREICLTSPDSGSTQNYFTVLIGRNGAGKSTLLAEICKTFAFMDGHSTSNVRRDDISTSPFEVRYSIDGQQIRLRRNKRLEFTGADWAEPARPSRVIATTITPFDKFPIGNSRSHLRDNDHEFTDERIYRYLGSKNRIGQLSATGQISRVVESLLFASGKSSGDRQRLSQVFELLGYAPSISVDYAIRFSRKTIIDLLGSGNSGDPEIIKRVLTGMNTPTRYRLEHELHNAPLLVEELWQSLVQITQATHNTRTLTFELDFSSGFFSAGSLELFQHVLRLRRYGFFSLRDLKLRKHSSPFECINLRDASSGEQCMVLTFLGIASEIEDFSLVVIDEPEISLHPQWQEAFIPLLMSTFKDYRGCHFLLATHSPQTLTRVGETGGAVVLMDEHVTQPAIRFTRRSSDFQLATAFGSPGYRNEYLAREGLTALNLASQGKVESDDFAQRLAILKHARPKLSPDDPVAALIDVLLSANKAHQQ